MTKRKSLVLGFISVFALIGISTSSFAFEKTGPISAGVLLGPTFGNSSTIFTFGAEGTYQWMPPWAVGASVTYYSKDFGSGFNSSLTTLTAEGLYFFDREFTGFRAGLQLGLGFTGTSIPRVSGSTDFIIGPTAGYDYQVGNQISVGAESTLYFTTQSNTGAFLQLLATARYWF